MFLESRQQWALLEREWHVLECEPPLVRAAVQQQHIFIFVGVAEDPSYHEGRMQLDLYRNADSASLCIRGHSRASTVSPPKESRTDRCVTLLGVELITFPLL
jgi:hypothetical protein